MRPRNSLLVLIVALLVLSACAPTPSPDSPLPAPTYTATPAPEPTATTTPEPTPTPSVLQEYPNAHLLVDTSWVQEHLSDPDLLLVDMRSPADYAQAHVPGAISIPVDRIVAAVDGVPFEFEESRVREALSAAGITSDHTVVIYDDLGMLNSARLFWTLEYVGHDDARVLDGGWNAWTAQPLPTEAGTPTIEPTEYEIDLRPDRLIDAEDLLESLGDPDVAIVDARSPGEYTGELVFAQRGGHIPGAVLLTWLDAITGGDAVHTTEPGWDRELQDDDVEVFRSPSELQALLDDLGLSPDQTVITYCQTLWRGAHAYFLFRLMGYDDVRGYDGSWVEWGNRPSLPVVTGPEPGAVP